MRFYGERTLMWLREEDLEQGPFGEEHKTQLHAWGRANRKCESLHEQIPLLHALTQLATADWTACGLAALAGHGLIYGQDMACM